MICLCPVGRQSRDKEHCKFVVAQPCVVCGRTPAEAHHIRFAQPRALNRKARDEYTVPVCRLHHRDLHSYGDETSWWAGIGIDPLPKALEHWRRSRLTCSLHASLKPRRETRTGGKLDASNNPPLGAADVSA